MTFIKSGLKDSGKLYCNVAFLCAGIHCFVSQTGGALFLFFSDGGCQWKDTQESADASRNSICNVATWGPIPRSAGADVEVHCKSRCEHTLGNNQVQRDFLDNLQQVKHGNSFLPRHPPPPTFSLYTICRFSARENHKKFTLTTGSECESSARTLDEAPNSGWTYWVSSRVTAQSPQPVLLLQHRLPSFSLPVMLYWLCILANISLLSHLSSSSSSPPLSLAGCLYLSSHPPWCFFSPSLQSMWLLRCLSICSPRQAQCAGATLWLLGQ